MIDLENQVRVMGESSGSKEFDLALGEIDCCKGILYSLVGINKRILERVQVGRSLSFGRSLLS